MALLTKVGSGSQRTLARWFQVYNDIEDLSASLHCFLFHPTPFPICKTSGHVQVDFNFFPASSFCPAYTNMEGKHTDVHMKSSN